MKSQIIKIISLLAFLAICKMGLSQDTVIFYKKPLAPNYINTQFAGNVGAMVLGAGYRLNPSRTLEFVIAYGYTPKYEAAKRIHNLSFKTILIPVEWKIGKNWYLFPQTGFSVSRQFPKGTSTFITLPNTYPHGYYSANAFRVHLNFGGKIRKEYDRSQLIEAIEFYAETTTNDRYLQYYFKSKEVGLRSIFSMALGANFVLFNLKTPGIVIK